MDIKRCLLYTSIVQQEMEQVVKYSVPLTAEVGTGHTWLEAH